MKYPQPSLNNMSSQVFIPVNENQYTGTLVQGLSIKASELKALTSSPKVKVLAEGRHRIIKVTLNREGHPVEVAIKCFGKQQGWKDWSDQKRGSKASRSFLAAQHLHERGVSTPEPLGYIDHWAEGRLVESYFLSIFEGELTDMRKELDHIYAEDPQCHRMVRLMTQAGKFIRSMHDAGFQHRDLGVQNIMLRRTADGGGKDFQVIDLNRGRIRKQLTQAERGRDFDRLNIPGAFLSILVSEYSRKAKKNSTAINKEFTAAKLKYSKRYQFHVKTRRLRKPKHWGRKRNKVPPYKNIWLWDDRSSQASVIMSRKERGRCYTKDRFLNTISSVLKFGLPTFKVYQDLIDTAYQKPVSMKSRVAIALEAADIEIEPQLPLLDKLGTIPVSLRIGHHENKEQWDKSIALIKTLASKGHEVMLVLMQDRRAVNQPESWESFLNYIFDHTAESIHAAEICHTVNRAKWGVWTAHEHGDLMRPVIGIKQQHPHIKFTGPSCIDFEYYYIFNALRAFPRELKLDALSHQLYVDRRGAPENYQGKLSLLEKATLLKASAKVAPQTEEQVIVSEVNWPLRDTGTWSPVNATYLPNSEKQSKLAVSEELYGSYMLRYYVISLCSGMIERVYWWRLASHGFGLVDERDNWRPRPAYFMLATFLEILGESTFLEKLDSPDQVYLFKFRTSCQDVILAWSNEVENYIPDLNPVKVIDATGKETSLTTALSEVPCYYFPKTKSH